MMPSWRNWVIMNCVKMANQKGRLTLLKHWFKDVDIGTVDKLSRSADYLPKAVLKVMLFNGQFLMLWKIQVPSRRRIWKWHTKYPSPTLNNSWTCKFGSKNAQPSVELRNNGSGVLHLISLMHAKITNMLLSK